MNSWKSVSVRPSTELEGNVRGGVPSSLIKRRHNLPKTAIIADQFTSNFSTASCTAHELFVAIYSGPCVPPQPLSAPLPAVDPMSCTQTGKAHCLTNAHSFPWLPFLEHQHDIGLNTCCSQAMISLSATSSSLQRCPPTRSTLTKSTPTRSTPNRSTSHQVNSH